MDHEIWSLIRETRSARPGKAQDDAKRAAVYGSALQQFEELMRAAETTGYASRPLPLFYAVSQAGRAIAAAHADEPWILSGHGLKHSPGSSSLRSTVIAKPGGADSFSHVAGVTGEYRMTEPVELGALWASLPDLWPQNLRKEQWRRPLSVRRKEEEGRHRGHVVGATIFFLHERSVSKQLFQLDDARDDGFVQALDDEMKHYPTAQGWSLNRPQNLSRDRRTLDGWEVEVAWQAADQGRHAREAEFESHMYEHRVRDQWWLRPDLNDAGDFLWPLMTWWSLLFGLSMLARYHPAEWAAALRVDKSNETVPLEAALNQALVAVPHFIYEALIGLKYKILR